LTAPKEAEAAAATVHALGALVFGKEIGMTTTEKADHKPGAGEKSGDDKPAAEVRPTAAGDVNPAEEEADRLGDFA